MAKHRIDTLLAEAFSLVKQKRMLDAEQLLTRICQQDKKNSQAWFMRGAIQFGGGDINSALKFLNKTIKLDSRHIEAHFTLCKIYLSRGNLPKAIAHAKRVVSLDDKHGAAWLALSSFYADSGQFEKAEQASRTAITLLPSVAEAKINLMNALISQNKQEEAMTLCQSLKADNPINPGIWHSLGLAFKSQGLMADADYCLTKVTQLDPKNADAFCTLGEIKAAQEEISSALGLYQKSRELSPTNPRVHFELGKVLLANSSERHWQRVQQLHNDHQYQNIQEAEEMAKSLATNFRYGDAGVERTLLRFFNDYDPSQLYTSEWWSDVLRQFGEPKFAHDTALRSVYSAVFSWSLPCQQVLEDIANFTGGQQLASYGAGSGYWEYLLSLHYGVNVMCHDMVLRNRFTTMQKQTHADATINPDSTLFLAWVPGEPDIDADIESLLNQTQVGQKLVLVGEPADDYGYPRTCGTPRFFHYLRKHFKTRSTLPLANYAYFTDRVELLVRK
jgi:tetratricopeptide (TPR) repeat protein